MDVFLNRKKAAIDGIFGELVDEQGNFIFVTLEHAYYENGIFSPKIKAGVHKCVLYSKLFPGKESRHGYDVYVLDSPDDEGHYYELHIGCFNRDSEGCILIGTKIGPMINGGEMICGSKIAFDAFMKMQAGNDSFLLTVVGIKCS